MVFVDHTRNICRQELQAKEKQHLEEERQIPHFSNLNEDPALNGKLIHLAKAGLYQTYIYQWTNKRHSDKTGSNLQFTHVLILYYFSYKTCDENVKIYYNLVEVSVQWFKCHKL